MSRNTHNHRFLIFATSLALCLVGAAASSLQAAIKWDAQGNSPWWFDKNNWDGGAAGTNNTRIPPTNETGGATDAQVNIGGGAWDLGEGVVYDPSDQPGHDPNFAAAASLPFPDGFNRQRIDILYLARGTTSPFNQPATLTIKGDLTTNNIQVGKSSIDAATPANGRIVQTAGLFKTAASMDIAQTDTSAANVGYGHGVYDYRGGSLEVNLGLSGSGIRMSHGTATNSRGTGGHGRIIMHNPATPGHFRTNALQVASFAGNAGAFDPAVDPNGVTRGVGVLEFHVENGATRPIQIELSLSLNNGLDTSSTPTGGTRSSRLDLVLDGPPALKPGNIPANLGLVDTDYLTSDFVVGNVGGTGTLGGTFNTFDGATNLPEGATVSAVWMDKRYTWTISYHGIITWQDGDAGTLTSVEAGAPTTNSDVVLLGQSVTDITVDADFDNNGFVDGGDFLAWQRNFFEGGYRTTQLGAESQLLYQSPNFAGTTNAMGDANGSGSVRMDDYLLWAARLGTTVPLGAGVPEPGSIALMVGAIASLMGVRRRAAATRS